MKNRNYLILHLFLLALSILGLQTATLADVIDTTFNAQVQTTTFRSKFVQYLITLPNGKTLAAGNFNTYNGQPVGGLIRLNADASLDTTFNNDLLMPAGGISSINLLADGKILLRGTFTLTDETQYSNTIVRLNADGTIDSTFNYIFTGNIAEVKTDANDRILVSGFIQVIENGNPVNKDIIRLNDNGTLDSSFNLQPLSNGVEKFTPQNNKVLYTTYDATIQQNRLHRLNENGTNDSSFASTPVGSFQIMEMQAQSDNKILILADNRLFRVNENGGNDSGFQLVNFPNQPRKLLLQSDGRITIAHGNTSPFGMRIIRILPNGTSDPSFTSYDYTGTELGGHAVQIDGGVLLGDGSNGSLNRFTRLLPSGAVDTSFNPGGTGFLNINPGKIRAISVLADDKILIGGDFDRVNNINRTKIARLNADSTLDTSFQINTSGTGNSFFQITDVYNFAVQTDGKIVVSGSFGYFVNSAQKWNVVRLNTDGSIDPSFDLSLYIDDWFVTSGLGKNKPLQMANGKILVGTTRTSLANPMSIPLVLNTNGSKDTSFNPTIFNTQPNVSIFDTALQTDGKILISGKYVGGTINKEIRRGFIARLNSDGTIDQSFQAAELVDKEIFAFTVLQNGQILNISRTNLQSNVSRLNSNGTLDNSFNTGIGANGRINAIAVLPGGKILVGGAFTTYNNQPRQNLALLNADGTLDESLANINREVLCITLDNEGRVLIGGHFTSLNDGGQQFNISYVARLNVSPQQIVMPYFDFDGDGKTDISIFRPPVGEWWVLGSSNNQNFAAQFGNSADKLAPADFTGDGKTDIGIFRPSTGEWFILRSDNGSFYGFPFGTNGDIPAPADFDGDGKADVAVFRPSTATWYISKSNGGTTIQQFGQSGDVPVVSDYDGDGKADIAIYRPSLGEWWIQRSTAGTIAFQFGNSADKAVPGDYTGDGKSDVAIFRPATGEWFILRSENQSFYAFPFGISTDIPAPGDYDGDGKFDAAIFRPSDANWYLLRSTAGFTAIQFGFGTDRPVPSVFIP